MTLFILNSRFFSWLYVKSSSISVLFFKIFALISKHSELNLIKSESGNYYYFTDDLDFDVSYLKVFVGESYE